MKVLLITPPMVQINTPYPATPVLTGFLKEQGVETVQADLSLAVALELFSRDGVLKAAEAGAALAAPSAHLAAFLRDRDRYLRGVDCAVSFLQGLSPELAWTLGRRGFLPENTHFRELDPSGEGLAEENLRDFFGILGILFFIAALPMGLGFLVLLPVSFAGIYASYRDIFPSA